jgi:REP element-mobilizing transposase RayT
MKSRACTFDERSRGVVEAAIREVIEYRNWGLYALAVRTNHVHIVVCAEVPPSILLHDFKSRATRLLREAGLASENERIWARHGSTRYLHTPDDIRHAIEYAMEGQGGDLSGV